jgi:serine/threonine protein kinase
MAFKNNRGRLVIRSDRTLHRYVITGKLGNGGFGEVFKATMVDLAIPVAVKKFMPRSSGQKVLENWAQEYSTHEALSHPNILQAYDAFEDSGDLYLVTELASNSINHYIDDPNANPPWDDTGIARAAVHIASALHYLHVGWRRGTPLVHRDVTPNNVFLFEDSGRFKLGDFGISKLLAAEDAQAYTTIGNWDFVAPELIRNGFTVPQSDLFQLGLVLYTMAACDYLVPKSAPIKQKMDAIAGGAAWRAANALQNIDEELQTAIKKLLLRDLNNRYASAADAHADFLGIYKRLRAK